MARPLRCVLFALLNVCCSAVSCPPSDLPCVVVSWDWGTQSCVQSYNCSGCDSGIVRPVDVVFVISREDLQDVASVQLMRSTVQSNLQTPQLRYAILALEFLSSASAVIVNVVAGFSSEVAYIHRAFAEYENAVEIARLTLNNGEVSSREQIGALGVVATLTQLFTGGLGPHVQVRPGSHRHLILFTHHFPMGSSLHPKSTENKQRAFSLTKAECTEFAGELAFANIVQLLHVARIPSFVFVSHFPPELGTSLDRDARSTLGMLQNLTSLQATLLSNCIPVHILEAHRISTAKASALLGPDFSNALSSSLFCDPCLEKFVPRNCGEQTCIHGLGCVTAQNLRSSLEGPQKYGYGLSARYGEANEQTPTEIADSFAGSPVFIEECPAEFNAERWSRTHLVKKQVPIRYWSPREAFLEEIVAQNEPVVLRHTIAATWPALTSQLWELSYLKSRLKERFTVLRGVKVVRRASQFKVFDADQSQPMNFSADMYSTVNLGVDKFFEYMADPPQDVGVYHFMKLPSFLRPDVSPDSLLYVDYYDLAEKEQYLWLSSRGPSMHTHFDQDRNVFIQLVGRKRFVLFPPSAHQSMYVYPRVHPLWHKAQPDFDEPDLMAFPEYANVEALEATLEPGDVLYVPPYYFHHVESLTASVSLSTWSTERTIKIAMDAAYGRGAYAQELKDPQAKVAALRLFIELLLRELEGVGQLQSFRETLLRTRFNPLRDQFPTPDESFLQLCMFFPMSPESMKEIEFDVAIVVRSFLQIDGVQREILLFDFIEQVACSVVGVDHIYAFFSFCLLPQHQYRVVSNSAFVKREEETPKISASDDELKHTRCVICHKVVHSHAEAQHHFDQTGHINFEPFREEL